MCIILLAKLKKKNLRNAERFLLGCNYCISYSTEFQELDSSEMVTAHARIHQSYFLCEIMMDKLMLKGYRVFLP